MGAPPPAVGLAHLLGLPARHFAVVDPDGQRTRILVATVTRGRPRILDSSVIDARAEGFTTPEEMREEVRHRVRDIAPEAVILVLPQHRLLRHVLDVPPGDAAQTRALVEREASNIGGLSESTWAFAFSRLRPFAGRPHPLAAAFCRHGDLGEILDGYVDDEDLVFDVRPAGDALAAAFRHAAPDVQDAILIDLGPEHTGVTLFAGGQPVFSTSFPTGNAALAEPTRGPADSSDVPSAAPVVDSLEAWRTELERTILEWCEDHPELATAAQRWPAILAVDNSLEPALASLNAHPGGRAFSRWPLPADPHSGPPPETAVAWGAFLLALGIAGPAPSFLPRPRRDYWAQQRFWRWLLSANLLLVAVLAIVMAASVSRHRQVLDGKAAWRTDATRALENARDIRVVAGGFNERMDGLRPILDRQRQTVETLQILAALQQQRTNADHWFVLLADHASYAAGSNHFPISGLNSGPRATEPRFSSPSATSTNLPSLPDRTFIAEVCLLPQGEKMRQALSDLVSDLKRFPLFRNVDVLPAERRRAWVATNLIFPERHFALELNLSEAELLPVLSLPRPAVTNREPRNAFRSSIRPSPEPGGNGPSNGIPPRGGRAR